jgi:hypothetical protein
MNKGTEHSRSNYKATQRLVYYFGMQKRRCVMDPDLAKAAKSIVAHAFRNGPIEDIHAGIDCPTCAGKEKYSHITEAEMKSITKNAVDKVFTLLWLRDNEPEKYRVVVECGALFTGRWDEPEFDFTF